MEKSLKNALTVKQQVGLWHIPAGALWGWLMILVLTSTTQKNTRFLYDGLDDRIFVSITLLAGLILIASRIRQLKGHLAVVVDKGDSITWKGWRKDRYAAAIELAISKGWTSIELMGSKKTVAETWLEAKLKGLNVVNYEPSKEYLAKLAGRLMEASKAAGVEVERPAVGALTVKQQAADLRLIVVDADTKHGQYFGPVVGVDHRSGIVKFARDKVVELLFSGLAEGQARPGLKDSVWMKYDNGNLVVNIAER